MSDTVIDLSASSAFQRIDERRTLLKKVVAIARAIERMQDSLEAVLVLGEETSRLPGNAITFFEGLSGKVRNQPTEKLQEYLRKLQILIHRELKQIIEFSRLDLSGQEEELPFTDESLKLLKEFKRRAQTAVSLRVILLNRGAVVPKATIPVPVREIRDQLTDLNVRERQQREKVKSEILAMKEDLQAMIDGHQHNQEMTAVFQGVIEGLERDLEAIRLGRRISELPHSFESVESGQSRAEKEAILRERGVEGSWPEEDGPTPEEPAPQQHEDEAPAPAEKAGFLKRVSNWLNSPWGVTWKDVNKD